MKLQGSIEISPKEFVELIQGLADSTLKVKPAADAGNSKVDTGEHVTAVVKPGGQDNAH